MSEQGQRGGGVAGDRPGFPASLLGGQGEVFRVQVEGQLPGCLSELFGLVLQPDFVMSEPASPVVAGSRAGLVVSSALRPGKGVGEWTGDRRGQVCQETADFCWCEADQAAWAFGA